MLRQAFLALALLIAAAAQARADAPSTHDAILIIGPDMQLAERSAAGDALTRPDWSSAAQRHVADGLATRLRGSNRSFQFISADALMEGRNGQLLRLHAVVAEAALGAKGRRGSAARWSIGEGARELAGEYHADYGLIVGGDGVYGSAPRDMLALASTLRTAASAAIGNLGAAASLGLHAFRPSGSGRRIAASLVDLQSGDIIWIRQIDGGRELKRFGD